MEDLGKNSGQKPAVGSLQAAVNAEGIAGKPLAPHAESSGTVFQTIKAANTPAAPLPKHDINESIDILHREGPLENLRTYESDVARAVENKQASLVKIAMAQKERQYARPVETPKTTIGNGLMLIASIVLIFLSIFVFIFLFFFLRKTVITAIVVTTSSNNQGLISAESSKNVLMTKNDNALSIITTQENSLHDATGTITVLNFNMASTSLSGATTTIPVDIQTFFTTLKTQAPDWFIRALGPNYFVGYYNNQGNQEPVFVFQVSSYQNAFAGMLQWEQTIGNNFSTVYPESIQTSTATTIAATTISTISTTSTQVGGTKSATSTGTKSKTVASSTSQVVSNASPIFEDVIVSNKPARELIAGGQPPILIYSFPDKKTLVIVESQNALKEIFSRLATSQFVQ